MQPSEQRRARLSEIAGQLFRGAIAAGVAFLVARFLFTVLRARHVVELELMTELACSLASSVLVLAVAATVRPVRREAVLGALAAAPLAYGLSDRFVDAILAVPLPEMGPTFTMMFVVTFAFYGGALTLGVGVIALRLFAKWADRAINSGGAVVCVACLALVARAAVNEGAPGIDAWREYVAGLESSAGLGSAREELAREPSAFVPLEVPVFFEHAYAARVPDLPTGWRERTYWTTPIGLQVPLNPIGVHGTLDSCFLETGQIGVLLRSNRGALLLQPTARGLWRPCSLPEGSDMHAGLTVSQASFGSPFGAPVGCAWLLLAGSACSLILLIASWRERRLARWIGTLEKASLVRAEDGPSGTAQLPDGQLGRLEGEAPEGGEAVLIPASERAGADAAYRGDARKRIAEWLSVSGSREEMIADRRRRAGKLDALALFVAVWLGLPALSAYVHGFVVSFG